MKMSASQFMDKQIMDLTASGSNKKGGSKDDMFLDLVSSRIHAEQNDAAAAEENDDSLGKIQQSDYSRENSVYADEETEDIVPSYDFHPTIRRDTGSSVSRAWASADSKSTPILVKNYSSLDSMDPIKAGEPRPSVDMAGIVTEIDRAMKKHSEDLFHALDVVSARLTQLETRIRNMENSVDDVKVAVGNSHGSTDGKMRQLENILREVQTGVQAIKDKQEIVEAQLQLSKMQLPKRDQSHFEDQAAVAGATLDSEPASQYSQHQFQPSVSLPLSTTPISPAQQNFPPPPPQQNYPPPAPQQSFPPPAPHQSFPSPAPQQSFPSSVPQQSFPSSGPQSFPPPLPQQSFPPPAPQQNFPNAPHQNFSSPTTTIPTQFPQNQVHPTTQHDSYHPSAENQETVSQQHHLPSMPPSQFPPPLPHQPYPLYPPPSQPLYPQPPPPPHPHPLPAEPPYPTGPPDSSYGMHTSLLPTGYGPSSQYGGAPGAKPPHLPTARILPQALPTASSVDSSPQSGTSNRVPIDDVVDRVANMGFPRDQVRATVQRLTEDGQSVELNIVLDKLMNGGETQPRRGWFDRT